jgi:hypothetical protein
MTFCGARKPRFWYIHVTSDFITGIDRPIAPKVLETSVLGVINLDLHKTVA